MTLSKALSYFIVLLLVLICFGCAGTQSGSTWSSGKVPPGVSREISARADTIAGFLFVPRVRETQARDLSRTGMQHYQVTDSLWKLLDEMRGKSAAAKAAPRDSAKNSVSLGTRNVPSPQSAKPGADVLDSRTSIQAKFNLLEARKKLESALVLDPYKPEARHYLALTYKLFAERFPRDVSLERAAEQWSQLAALEPGEYRHFYNLGAVYFAQQQWQKAFANFQRTEQLLQDYPEVSNERLQNPTLAVEAVRDSVRLFDAVYLQAQALIHLAIAKQQRERKPEAEATLTLLKRARTLTNEPHYFVLIDGDIKWLQWDSLNVWGAAQRDTADALVSRGDFKGAVEIYDALLNNVLHTKRAKDDVRWDYAKVAYAKLKQRALGIERLAEVIRSVAQDSSGAPRDTTYNRMFEEYGAMCYFLGQDTMRADRKIAFQYFEHAAAVAWKDRGRCYLFMADLTKTNADLSLKNAEAAFALSDHFTLEEMKNVYRLLIDGYRRKNQMDKARHYMEKFREL